MPRPVWNRKDISAYIICAPGQPQPIATWRFMQCTFLCYSEFPSPWHFGNSAQMAGFCQTGRPLERSGLQEGKRHHMDIVYLPTLVVFPILLYQALSYVAFFQRGGVFCCGGPAESLPAGSQRPNHPPPVTGHARTFFRER